MISTALREKEDWFSSDEKFDTLYPPGIRTFSRSHWTPLAIAKMVAPYLGVDGPCRILDIGSGVGKFCLAAAHQTPFSIYYGVEQRGRLVDIADTAKGLLGLSNVNFIHANFTELDLSNFDHFYFYNSFFENLSAAEPIDESVPASAELYRYYTEELMAALHRVPAGARLCTLCTFEDEIPPGFRLVKQAYEGLLRFWIKE